MPDPIKKKKVSEKYTSAKSFMDSARGSKKVDTTGLGATQKRFPKKIVTPVKGQAGKFSLMDKKGGGSVTLSSSAKKTPKRYATKEAVSLAMKDKAKKKKK
tara:strand:- start:538 stop:840 length:303 start_codon:yes stop_codon:yes gene_type:complete